MFVLIARQIYHVTLTAHGVNNVKVNNHFQMRQTRRFSCKSVKNLLKYKMIQNNQCIFSYIFNIDYHFIIRSTLQCLPFSSAVWPTDGM